MNQTELSTELKSLAADATRPDGMARMVGVRRRIRNRRRARAGGGVAVVLVAAACAIGFGAVPALPGARAVPPASSVNLPSANSIFATSLDGDPLGPVVLGARGAAEASITFTPTDTNLMASFYCRVPVTPSDSKMIWVTGYVNGHRISASSCSSDYVPGEVSQTPSDNPAKNRADWAKWGVVPGRQSVLKVRLENDSGAAVTNPSVRLGVALYVLSGARVWSHDVPIKVDASSDGHAYRLTGYRTLPISRTQRAVTLTVPADREPSLLLGGVYHNGSDKGRQSLRIDGQDPQSSSTGGTSTQALPDAKAHTVTLSVDQASGNSGVLLLAFYQRVD